MRSIALSASRILSFYSDNAPSSTAMSAAAEGQGSTTKAVTADETSSTTLKDQQKPAAALEEDDEFEDFPVEGMFPRILFLSKKDDGLTGL